MVKFDIVTVGHFTLDLISLPNKAQIKSTLGGPPTYVSLAAKKLNVNVSVISKVGKDFLDRYVRFLLKNGVDLSTLKRDESSMSTCFFLDYNTSSERYLVLKNKAPSIKAVDVPDVLDVKTIHVAPVVNEIPNETLSKLRTFDSTISLDPQGFVRRFRKDGKASLRKLRNKCILNGVDIIKATYNEAEVITGHSDLKSIAKIFHKKGIEVVLITRGAEPTFLSVKDKMFLVPSAKSKSVVDTTGAGDVFIGGYLATFVNGEEPLWCACIGSAAASFVIEKYGPKGFGSVKQVQQRATTIYDKISVVS